MELLKCPVCNQEYNEGKEICEKCHWLLIPYPDNLAEISELEQREEIRLQWERKRLQSEREFRVKIITQLGELKKQNQILLNYSLSENHLQDISFNVKQINEKLSPDYLHNSNKLVTTQDTENPGDIESISQVSEVGDINNNLWIDEEITNLVNKYNQQDEFIDKIEVSETENSKTQRWGGGRSPVIFERNNRSRGEYWIIDTKYLVPKPKQKINQNSYKTLAVLFEIHNYEPNSTDNIILIKPAKVSLIAGEEQWKLEETGIIQFAQFSQ